MSETATLYGSKPIRRVFVESPYIEMDHRKNSDVALDLNVERLTELIRSARLLDRLAENSLKFAHGDMARYLRLTAKYERQARLRSKGANRLRQSASKLCDQIKERLNNADKDAGRPSESETA